METELNDGVFAERPAAENPTAISKAIDFYREALWTGPRLAREVIAEGKRQGHAKRTQDRARDRLHVQKIPPTTWQGPWLIALPGHPAIDESKQLREVKKQKQQRKGNGRRKKQQSEGGSAPPDALLAAER